MTQSTKLFTGGHDLSVEMEVKYGKVLFIL